MSTIAAIKTDAPRCARPMGRYEKPGVPVLEDPACARPEGHAGPCRSARSYRKALDDAARRIAARRAIYGGGYGRRGTVSSAA